MIREPSICDACARLHKRYDPAAQEWVPYCTAFPDGVPDAVYLGGFDHRAPYPGDNDIRFLMEEGAEGVLEAYTERTRRTATEAAGERE